MKKNHKKRKKAILITALVLVILAVVAFLAREEINKKIYPLKFKETIAVLSEKYELDPYLVCAVIYTESSFQEDSKSNKGAVGLMQIMPQTGEWIAGKLKLESYSLLDPYTNIEMGCWYLHYLDKRFEGNLETMLAGYNAGPNKAAEWLKDERYSEDGVNLKEIPFQETKDYVYKVNRYYDEYKKLYTF